MVLLKKVSAEERSAEHKRIRARGMAHFILSRGILGFGAFTLSIDLVSSVLFGHRHVDSHFLTENILQWTAAGLFFGWFMWRVEFDADEDNHEPAL